MATLGAMDMRPLILIGIVIAIVFVATVMIMFIRKRVLSPDQARSTGMLMDDFRRLHAQGQLSDAEFQALRSRMAEKMKTAAPAKGSLHAESPRGGGGRGGAADQGPLSRPPRPVQRKPPPPA